MKLKAVYMTAFLFLNNYIKQTHNHTTAHHGHISNFVFLILNRSK